MSKYRNLALCSALASLVAVPAFAEKLGLGRPALPEEIAAWDLDVRPDGLGLPAGSGDVLTGEEVFSEHCAACHGEFAEGSGNWPKLAGGRGTLDHDDPLKTVGSYWPHLSTAFDYVNRSMPYGNANSLPADDIYAMVAYILYSNDLVDEDFVLSDENFAEVMLPNAGNFIVDDRPVTEYPIFGAAPCMAGCKDVVEITMRAANLDVTPNDPTDDAVEVQASAPVVEAPAAPVAPVVAVSAVDPALIAAGQDVYKKCAACHKVGEGARNGTGPTLNGIVGEKAGVVAGFKYSKPLLTMAEAGLVWDAESLDAFLADPKGFMKGTKMSFAGLKKAEERTAVIAYLDSLSK